MAESYFIAALDGWECQWEPQIGVLSNLSATDSCLVVGHFKHDLPAGDTQLKELGSSAKEVYKTLSDTPRKNSGSNRTLHGTIRNIPATRYPCYIPTPLTFHFSKAPNPLTNINITYLILIELVIFLYK